MNNSSTTLAVGPFVDWLSFTFKDENPDYVRAWLFERFHGATLRDRGGMGYTHSASILGSGLIFWHPDNKGMGVHVVLPSSALAVLASLEHFTPRQFITEFSQRGATFTRIDIATDTDSVTMDDVLSAYRSGCCVSRSTSRQYIEDLDGGGKTVYIGAAGARRRVRFYDKAAEQAKKGAEAPSVTGVWTRCEVEFKAEYAEICAQFIMAEADLRELVASAVDWRDPSDDSNVTRRERCGWWDNWILALSGSVSFSIRTVQKTIEDAYQWVVKSVAPTLAFLSWAFGSTDWLKDVALSNVERIPGHRVSTVIQYDLGVA